MSIFFTFPKLLKIYFRCSLETLRDSRSSTRVVCSGLYGDDDFEDDAEPELFELEFDDLGINSYK
jgi:hypothetical protein